MTDPAFFGYGSLVNLATHGYADPRPATLPGWHRVWRITSARNAAYLSALPGGQGIDGIVASVPGGDWEALDRREAAYDRVDVTSALGAREPVAVYRVAEGAEIAQAPGHGILRSYLDTVMQGFLAVYGQPGAERFLHSTKGWHLPLIDDRDAPLYPRAQVLSGKERAIIERCLAGLIR